MTKVLINTEGFYVGTMHVDFVPAPELTVVEVEDAFAETMHPFWQYQNGAWIENAPPAPPPSEDGSVFMLRPV